MEASYFVPRQSNQNAPLNKGGTAKPSDSFLLPWWLNPPSAVGKPDSNFRGYVSQSQCKPRDVTLLFDCHKSKQSNNLNLGLHFACSVYRVSVQVACRDFRGALFRAVAKCHSTYVILSAYRKPTK